MWRSFAFLNCSRKFSAVGRTLESYERRNKIMKAKLSCISFAYELIRGCNQRIVFTDTCLSVKISKTKQKTYICYYCITPCINTWTFEIYLLQKCLRKEIFSIVSIIKVIMISFIYYNIKHFNSSFIIDHH